MPAPTKKTAAESAAAEATAEPIKVEFRGLTFDIEPDLINSARFRLALASQQDHALVYEALGPVNAALFLTTITREDKMADVANEFLDSLRQAAGWGNS